MSTDPTARCSNPACLGQVEDGFCTTCGLEGALGAASSRRVTAVTSGTAATGSTTARSGSAHSGGSTRRTTRTASSRRALGLGLVHVPELPALDPATVILRDAVVPEARRICPACDEKLRREKGFCPKCGQAYSFLPPLHAGEVVAEQYEILGPLAYGGFGWIFLAQDRLLSRWVVLKGLLNARDEASAAAAVAERQFLAAVKHANIVGVYNFVRHGADGYIVMEYVGGRTLRALRKERGPLPPAEAIAYVHRILGAFAYLHAQEPPLIYCDCKPENIMLEGGDVKLIDLGAVRRADDESGDLFGTRGYSAPESTRGPSIAGDLFTLGRTLAVLLLDFKGFQGLYEFTLQPPDEQPLLAQHPSLHAFLRKATHLDPARRFASADEMAAQLAGVLREVVAVDGAEPRAAESLYFTADPLLFAAPELVRGTDPLLGRPLRSELAVECLPGWRVDPDDPAAGFLLSQSSLRLPARRLEMRRRAVERFPDSAEALLALVQALGQAGEFEVAERTLGRLDAPDDWRLPWLRGRLALQRERCAEAIAAFDAVVAELPGESAPKYALALAHEVAGQSAQALGLHQLLALADRGAIGASFGWARCALAGDDRPSAARALGSVPPEALLRSRAQLALARCLAEGAADADAFAAASTVASGLALEPECRHRLGIELHAQALATLVAGQLPASPQTDLLGAPFDEVPLRRALERTYRELARLRADPREKVWLIDRANEVRPTTLF
ncbi:MAG: protein kinase [Verrucomicrobia bacterium]|nr:protein kinase [Verrucomicrobiota bacterium]